MMVKGSVLDRTNVIGFQGFGVCGGSFPRWLKFADHCSQLGLGFRVFQFKKRRAALQGVAIIYQELFFLTFLGVLFGICDFTYNPIRSMKC